MLFACKTSAIAQQSVMDSLKLLLEDVIEDTTRIDLLNQLSFGHHQIDVSLCRSYGEEALFLSEQINDSLRICKSYNRLAIAANIVGDNLHAKDYLKKSLEIARAINEESLILACSHNLGLAYKQSGDIEKALEYFLFVIKIDEKNGDMKSAVLTLANIGNLYLSLKDTKKAYTYLKRAVEVSEKYSTKVKRTHPYQCMGDYYVNVKEYDKAIDILNKALVLSKEFEQNLRSATILRLLGICRFNLNDVTAAIRNFGEAEKLLIKTSDKQVDLLKLYETWAMVYIDIGEFEKALIKANKGIALTKDNKLDVSEQSFLSILARISEKTGRYQEALEYHKAASILQDSLQLLSNEKTILELDAEYQLEKKEIDNELLRVQQEKSLTEIKVKNNYIKFFLILALLFGIVAFQLFRANSLKNNYNKALQYEVSIRTAELNESNKQLKKSNGQLERFAYIASHDLKTPIRNIISFADLLERKLSQDKDDQALEYLSFIKAGGKRMNALVKDILDYSKLKDKNTSGPNDKIDLNLLCEEIRNTIFSVLKEKNATIKIEKSLPVVEGNYSSMYLLFKNLIENAIKYNISSNPIIKLSYQIDKGSFLIIFADNGIGIPEEFQSSIWDMFSRLHNQEEYEGTGLGLATCKKIMEAYEGSISVTSKENEGSVFKLKFPISYLVETNNKENELVQLA